MIALKPPPDLDIVGGRFDCQHPFPACLPQLPSLTAHRLGMHPDPFVNAEGADMNPGNVTQSPGTRHPRQNLPGDVSLVRLILRHFHGMDESARGKDIEVSLGDLIDVM